MQQKRYIDTTIYLYLCETDDSNHSCHPNRKEAQIVTSYLACEEALYAYINKPKGKGTFVNDYTDITELINKLNEFNKKIKISDNNLSGIYGKSQEIIDNLVRSKIELKKSLIPFQKNKSLDAMDIFHLAYADSEGCRQFATTDKGFLVLKKLNKNYSIQNIKEILIYDSNNLGNNKNNIVKIQDYSDKDS